MDSVLTNLTGRCTCEQDSANLTNSYTCLTKLTKLTKLTNKTTRRFCTHTR